MEPVAPRRSPLDQPNPGEKSRPLGEGNFRMQPRKNGQRPISSRPRLERGDESKYVQLSVRQRLQRPTRMEIARGRPAQPLHASSDQPSFATHSSAPEFRCLNEPDLYEVGRILAHMLNQQEES